MSTIADTPEKWKEVVMPILPYIFNPEDYRLLIWCCSVLIILLINYPFIKYYYLIFKRKVGIEQKFSQQQLIDTALAASLQASSLNNENKKREDNNIQLSKIERTYIIFDADKYSFVESNNISSIKDNASGDISFNFTSLFINDYTINIDASKDVIFEIIERNKTNARILFSDNISGIIRIEFRELNANT